MDDENFVLFGEEGAQEGPQLTYGSYLRLPQLLDAQHLESDPPAHDELLFITIHQVYELWFQQLLHEAEAVRDALVETQAESGGRDLWFARHLLSRMHVIERVLVQQVDVLETMTPQDFLEFRQRLAPASGFQSVQFRELEFLSGAKDAGYVDRFRGLTDAGEGNGSPGGWRSRACGTGSCTSSARPGSTPPPTRRSRRRCGRSPATARRTPTSGGWPRRCSSTTSSPPPGAARHVVMVERMIGVEDRDGRIDRFDVPAQPAGPEVLPAAVGPPLGPVTTCDERSELSRIRDRGVVVGRCPGGCAVLMSKRVTALEQSKSELLTRLCSHAESKGAKAPDGVDLPAVLKAFYRHVAPEDLLERDAADLYGAVMAQLRLAAERPQGKAAVRVFTPSVSVNGWSAGGHTVVEVVTDDMPFLVDSVSMALAEEQHDIHLVIHPQFVVRRDLGGQLHEILDEHAETDPHDVAPRVVDAPRDRPGLRRPARGDPGAAHQGAHRRARRRRGLAADAHPDRPDRRGPRGAPAAAARPRSSSRASRSCAGWPTTTSPSSATASTPSRPRATTRR